MALTTYRASLNTYLTTRMDTLAPNLSKLVGDTIGAKLIAHGGTLINLAKTPASTIQLIGAEKALFRALKTKSKTTKYGVIYHAEMVNKMQNKNKVSGYIYVSQTTFHLPILKETGFKYFHVEWKSKSVPLLFFKVMFVPVWKHILKLVAFEIDERSIFSL